MKIKVFKLPTAISPSSDRIFEQTQVLCGFTTSLLQIQLLFRVIGSNIKQTAEKTKSYPPPLDIIPK